MDAKQSIGCYICTANLFILACITKDVTFLLVGIVICNLPAMFGDKKR